MTKMWTIMYLQWSQRAKKLTRVPIKPIKYLKPNPVATHFKVLDQSHKAEMEAYMIGKAQILESPLPK